MFLKFKQHFQSNDHTEVAPEECEERPQASQEPLSAVAGGGAEGREVEEQGEAWGSGEGSTGPPPEQCAGMCLICLRDV